ncbi:hypothetical protein N752_03195 [Desulforamulus aquiferis]|nr:hypothetical protein [Desulforamulus aquiferis]RYD06694.1 hypothetical protein N752_03195 [Desulforamulus aquiferis]
MLVQIKHDMEEVVSIANATGSSNNVVKAFADILAKTKVVTQNMMEVATDAQTIQKESQRANSEIIKITELVTSTTESVETIAAFTEEQSASIQELTSSAEEVNLVTKNIKEKINQYKF